MTAKTPKLCTICELRPRMSSASKRERGTSFPYCDPCQDLAEWENVHSDYGHDATSETVTSGGLDETKPGTRIKGCWICFPELDQTAADYSPRAGTSRSGMVINVTLRASGKAKATEVAAKLDTSYTYTVSVRKGTVTLKATNANGDPGLVLRWDSEGHYLYAESSAIIDGKTRKVRNVSEALRLAA